MAAKLNELCLQKTFKFASEYQHDLFNCALVNRHWCMNAIPILWRIPFPFSLHGGPAFISTLIKYLTLNDEQRAPFLYYRLIKQIDVYLFAEAIQDYLLSLPNTIQQDSLNIVTLCTLKVLCHKLINTENIIFELDYRYRYFDNAQILPFGDWNIYQIPNAHVSLRNLRKLSISGVESSRKILESAAKISRNLSNLEITCYCFTEYEELCWLIHYIKLFDNLKCLNMDVSITHGDKLLSELGKNLPKTLETLCLAGSFEFSKESLEQFLLGANQVKFQLLGFPKSQFISDEHLETIWNAIYDSSLDISIKELDISVGKLVTRNQAKKFQDRGIKHLS
ncbi:72_t:CDS:2 [Ambispora gerdemannii]|uniref:72_t:CDS:1 n=1 Tax=Ambispora gerdemannii TaxID=144530 RepID=A0A9N9FRE9_9GLOM|nr:72_t:CDS:2 [Ambispora gerdemannii]